VGVVGCATVVRNVVSNHAYVVTRRVPQPPPTDTAPVPISQAGRVTVDLLDANESTWAFEALDRVGRIKKPHVRRLEPFVRYACRRNYCGLIADRSYGRPL
jgi:hypothetical protein